MAPIYDFEHIRDTDGNLRIDAAFDLVIKRLRPELDAAINALVANTGILPDEIERELFEKLVKHSAPTSSPAP